MKNWSLIWWILVNLCGIWNIYCFAVITSCNFFAILFFTLMELFNFKFLLETIEKSKK